MNERVFFTVAGMAAPQGSKARWGGETNPRTGPWRAAVAAEGRHAMGDRALIETPVKLTVRFIFPRPQGHYRTGKHAGELKETAPTHMTSKPDLDKLVRAIGDALTGVVLRDDSKIAQVYAIKQYGETAYAEIDVWPLTD